jgi:hypothetical protein
MGIRTWIVLGVCGLTTALACFPWNALAGDPETRCRNEACGEVAACAKDKSLIVNSRRIKLNYSIDEVGPSGVSTVELWATRDGKSWARYSNEPPPDGPLVVHVAEEGRYGFSIVVRNGVGMASPAPKAGDEAQVWVVVDETKPTVNLTRVTPGTGTNVGTLNVEWTATDERLTCKPVTLSVATKKDGPYTPFATAIENTGRYVWHMPREHPYSFFIRIEAVDKAGNVGQATTPEPIRIDLTRPKGTITGVGCEKKSASLTVIPAPAEKPAKETKPVSTPVVPNLNFITMPDR